jgi:transposase
LGSQVPLPSATDDRQANRALYTISICRLNYDPKTITYIARRLTERLSKRSAIRCVKCFMAREVYNDLKHNHNRT